MADYMARREDVALTPPVDTAPSPPTPDGTGQREQFAYYTAEALGLWMNAEPWQRQAIGKIAPRLARTLWLADMAIDEMIGAHYDDEQSEAMMIELVRLPEPEPLLTRLGRCTDTITDPDEGTFVICGTRLVDGQCPFAAHHTS